jgi:DNA replication protein DnaC
MEACGGARCFAREIANHGHEARLMIPRFVRPYVKSNKNEARDAEAICEAVTRPSMRFVVVKSQAQQDVLALHRDALLLVLEVLEMEAEAREQRKITRLRRAAQIPPGKTFETLDASTLPAPLMRKLRELARGEFLERAENALAFGLPGVGKSHAACAIGNALIELGHSVLFRPAYQLVQELLAAKRDLALPQKLRRLDSIELLILDDIGYVKQSPEEAEVLFTLIAERYERRSMLITSNLVFSDWERIFKDPMATAAAIDRLVHHATILEFNVPSYRTRKRRRTDAGQPGEAVDASPG